MVHFSKTLAQEWIGLSADLATKLDAQDGKEDGNISASVFDEAYALQKEAKTVKDMQGMEGFLQKVKQSKVGNIISGHLISIMNNLTPIKALKEDGFRRMSYIADAADKYIKEHGSPAGFSINNIPIGIKSVKLVKCAPENTDASNDTVTFDANGNSVIKRKNDTQKYKLEWVWLDGAKQECNVPFFKA